MRDKRTFPFLLLQGKKKSIMAIPLFFFYFLKLNIYINDTTISNLSEFGQTAQTDTSN